jgi:hypothetical protein
MRIGIVGIRGIPNQYGGFEQFTEYIAPELVRRGHEVYVYNSSLHPYKESTWNGVHIVTKYDPEDKIGTAGQFIYDLNCILDARQKNFDIILQLGYTSSSIWTSFFPRKAALVTNMDGLEWKRTKYTKPVQRFLRYAERIAALKSDALIADSKGIQSYLYDKYGKASEFIAYGANLFTSPDKNLLYKFGLSEYGYNLVIARMEPENNIETIIKGHILSDVPHKLIIVGGYSNKFGKYLHEKYAGDSILFVGALYDLELLNNLRFFSSIYFHGHSVGGTNPSLLEAMSSDALIAAHNNIFNKSVLEEDAFYFSDDRDVADILNRRIQKEDFRNFLENNTKKIETSYSWKQIASSLENYLLHVFKHFK